MYDDDEENGEDDDGGKDGPEPGLELSFPLVPERRWKRLGLLHGLNGILLLLLLLLILC